MGAVTSLFSTLIVGLFTVSSLVYLWMFIIGITILRSLVPDESDLLNQLVSIDHQPSWNKLSIPFLHSVPALNNALLVCLFGLQHSTMQRGPLGKLLSRLLSDSRQKSVYVLATSICLYSLYLFWIPMPTVIWDITNPALRLIITALLLITLCSDIVCLLNLDSMRLLGIVTRLEDVTKNLAEKTERSKTLATSGFHGIVRHPLYTFSMMLMWVTPYMTVGHFLFSFLLTAYIVCAVVMFEEPDLIKEFGQDYVEYMKTTPRFVPRIYHGCTYFPTPRRRRDRQLWRPTSPLKLKFSDRV